MKQKLLSLITINTRKKMKNPNLNPPPRNPFTFTKGRTRITGDSNKKSLLVLCYLRELRWLLIPLGLLLLSWLKHLLSG